MCEDATYLSQRYKNSPKELLRRIMSLPCIAYLFIYLILQTFIHPRKGLHIEHARSFFQPFPFDVHTATSICKWLPRGTAVVLTVH